MLEDFSASNLNMEEISYFIQIQKGLVYITESVFLNSTVENNLAISNSYKIQFEMCLTLMIFNSTFQNIQSLLSPIEIAYSLSQENFTISNCKFFFLGAILSNGGALLLYEIQINIIQSNFLNNNAFKKGGAIYFECNLSLFFNIFQNNSADFSGGGDSFGKQ